MQNWQESGFTCKKRTVMKAIKLIIPIAVLLAVSTAAAYSHCTTYSKYTADTPAEPEMSFERMEYDFGTMKYKSRLQTYSFEFTNTGEVPLVITDAYKSCSCLSVKYPRRPLQPGEKGVIEVSYNPNKLIGDFNNFVKIYSNASQQYVLFVRGNVTK